MYLAFRSHTHTPRQTINEFTVRDAARAILLLFIMIIMGYVWAVSRSRLILFPKFPTDIDSPNIHFNLCAIRYSPDWVENTLSMLMQGKLIRGNNNGNINDIVIIMAIYPMPDWCIKIVLNCSLSNSIARSDRIFIYSLFPILRTRSLACQYHSCTNMNSRHLFFPLL